MKNQSEICHILVYNFAEKFVFVLRNAVVLWNWSLKLMPRVTMIDKRQALVATLEIRMF